MYKADKTIVTNGRFSELDLIHHERLGTSTLKEKQRELINFSVE
jgi:hypothetical protein